MYLPQLPQFSQGASIWDGESSSAVAELSEVSKHWCKKSRDGYNMGTIWVHWCKIIYMGISQIVYIYNFLSAWSRSIFHLLLWWYSCNSRLVPGPCPLRTDGWQLTEPCFVRAAAWMQFRDDPVEGVEGICKMLYLQIFFKVVKVWSGLLHFQKVWDLWWSLTVMNYWAWLTKLDWWLLTCRLSFFGPIEF